VHQLEIKVLVKNNTAKHTPVKHVTAHVAYDTTS